jgi:hypothetical protein
MPGAGQCTRADAALLQAQQQEPARHVAIAARIGALLASACRPCCRRWLLDPRPGPSAGHRRGRTATPAQRLDVYAAQARLAIAQIHDRRRWRSAVTPARPTRQRGPGHEARSLPAEPGRRPGGLRNGPKSCPVTTSPRWPAWRAAARPGSSRMRPARTPAVDEARTIAAYQQFLNAAPQAPQRPEALRRLGDLEMDAADRRAADTATGGWRRDPRLPRRHRALRGPSSRPTRRTRATTVCCTSWRGRRSKAASSKPRCRR